MGPLEFSTGLVLLIDSELLVLLKLVGLISAGFAAGQRRNWIVQKASGRCLALLNFVIHFQWDIWAGAITSGMKICLI